MAGKDEVEHLESSAFEALEKDFQEVLQELIGDKSLEHFRLEYEKLHRALKKSHESEKRLIKKCRELNGEIVSNATKVQTALTLSKEDQATIQNLKKEIERAWKMVEASHEKEQRAKETIHNLKVEIANLGHLVEQGAGLSVNQENTVNSLQTQRDELLDRRDKLELQVQKMTQENIILTETLQVHESEKLLGEAEIVNFKDMLNAKQTEALREHRRMNRLEKEMLEMRQGLEAEDDSLRKVENDVQVQEEQKQLHENTFRDQRKVVEALVLEEARLQRDIEDLKIINKSEQEELKKFQADNAHFQKELKSKQEDIKLRVQEKEKAQKTQNQLKRRMALDAEERSEIELSRNVLKSELENLLREIDLLKKQVESDNKAILEIQREKETLTKSVIRTDERTKKQADTVKQHEDRTLQSEREMTRVKMDVQEAMKKVHDLDKQREKYGIELSSANSKHMASLEELKNRDNNVSELKKNVADVKGKLAEARQAYESVRTDRNYFSKNLVESQDEIAEMKRKFKIMYHQIEQLKEESKDLDATFHKEHMELTATSKFAENVKDSMEKAKKKKQQLQEQMEMQQVEINKLQSRIHEAETERNLQKKKYEEIISDRDIQGTQLIRRNDELALLYEKIKIQQQTLQAGEICFKQRLEESRALQIKAADLSREIFLASQQVANIDDLRRETFQLQRELLRERTKVKALSEELENPLNAHRWRKLEGSDPQSFEMIEKVKTLQKRLIVKTEEAVEKDLTIQEKEKFYLELSGLLAKQPPQEIIEEVGRQQQSLKEKTKQMKAMAAEMNMYNAQLNDYKDEIERLTKELQDTKRRYFEQRRREQLLNTTRGHPAGS
mmetsp:Transcript_1947/g.5495  ORF Transcript_1947/g.5495 Transcript_1947/m.5495 type:complete len:846 (-) Transcript_1947:110-2647(-)|eukprot:CAMPEP_0194528978 /NCGR_PEP_ID=MMETSP0253-20130528/65533_1 /TAXON_ID=2966 /ORGANISM="Noctiluca scintillans" /LENGTH=845 /DNA_ID=CAMNT_0039374077 /DNA_START=70 /DNA_END=2607 /DNA_ORIENTATION=+